MGICPVRHNVRDMVLALERGGIFVVTAERLGLVVGFWRIGADVVVWKFGFPAEEGRFIVCSL